MGQLTTAAPVLPRDREPAHRRRLVVIAVLAVLVLAVGAVLWSRRGAREASLDEAARRFEQSTGSIASTPSPTVLVPSPGVYRYRGTGTERLSLLQTEQQWGPDLPATVTLSSPSNCWTFRIDYSTNHWQETSYCAENGVLRETAGKTWQRFDFVAMNVEDTTEFACGPPNDTIRLAASPGDTWTQSCTGHSPARGTTVTSAGSTTFVGRDSVAVGATTVSTLHYTTNRRLTGDQRGVETSDFWFAADTGQIMRFHRDDQVTSPSPLGEVTYAESGEYQLANVQPVAG